MTDLEVQYLTEAAAALNQVEEEEMKQKQRRK